MSQECGTEDPITPKFYTSGQSLSPGDFPERKIYIKLHQVGFNTQLFVAQYQDILDEVNSHYAPMNITFYFENCIENHGTGFYSHEELVQWNSPDKIDVFLKYTNAGGRGSDEHSYCNVRPDAEADVWSHEIGHIFQLYHTFRIDVIENSNGDCIEFMHECPNGEADYGDLIADTKGDPYSTHMPGTVPCQVEQGKYFDSCFPKANITSFHVYRCVDDQGNPATNNWDPPMDNFMSYHDCRTEFTNGQYNRMNNAIIQESHLAQLDMNAVPNPNIQPLDPNIYLQDVVITDHCVLDNEIWELGPGVRLIVEPTGSLTLNNSKILRADMFDVCNDENVVFDRWDGIYYNSPYPLHIVNSSEISGSENGIVLGGGTAAAPSFEPTEILIENSLINDHEKSLIDGGDPSLSAGGFTVLNIANSTLEFNNNSGGAAIEMHSTFVNISGGSILNYFGNMGNFFSIYRGGYRISNNTIDFHSNDIFFALYDGQLFPGPTPTANLGNVFRRNTIAMQNDGSLLVHNASGETGVNINNNTVTGTLQHALNTNSLGLYRVFNNDFVDGQIYLNNAYHGAIRNNIFGKSDIVNNNPYVFVDCNQLTAPSNGTAFSVEAILPQQWGSSQLSAGNTKTATGSPLAYFSAGGFEYYYEEDADEEDFDFLNIDPQDAANQAQCGTIGPHNGIGDGGDVFVYNDALLNLQLLETEEQQLVDSLGGLIDGGDTPGLLNSINNTSTVQDMATLHTLLDGIAPYLSSDAFDLLVAHPLISWQERVDILLDNQALIKKYREEIPTQYQGLLEYTTLDGRQLLEEQIFLNQRAQMELIALGLYHVENNTERDFWLSKMPVEFTSYISFKEKWSEWDFNAMDMILADLTLEEELHPMLLQDVQEFQPILDQLELWKTNNVNLYQLDSIQVDSLVALSDELTLYVSAPYAAFMKFFYGVDIQSNVLPQNRSADNQSWSTYVSNKAESKIRLAPNPGSECFRLINAEGTHKLALYDISGKLVLRGNVGEGEAFCPGASIDAGLYFIQYHNNHHTGTLKWIKE